MNSRIAIAGVLSLALLVTVGALGYRVTRQFMRYQATEQLFKEIYQSPFQRSSPDLMKSDIERLERAAQQYGGDRIEGMLVDRLAHKVWFDPDNANATLTKIFERTPVLTESPDQCPFVQSSGYLLTWSYQCAVLPELVERDADVAVARRPDLRSSVRNLQAYTRLMNDDLQGVRDLALRELSNRGRSTEAQAFALSCYVILGDYAEAQRYADSFSHGPVGDVNIQLAYLDLLIQQGRFKEAQAVAQPIVSSSSGNELASALAVPLYFLKGAGDLQTRRALKQMASSTRNPMSEAGAEAWVAARLFEVTGMEKFSQRLRNLAAQHPRDYDVWAARADSLMNREMWLEDGAMRELWENAALVDPAAPQTQANSIPEAVNRSADSREAHKLARSANELASTQIQQLQSELLLARSILYQREGDLRPEDKAELLRHLRLSLSAEGPEAGKVLDRVPDYDMLLTDRRLQALRESDPEFSAALHREVEQYVQRRMEYFRPAIEKGEARRLAYLAKPAPQSR